jgi:four helix bundle protein
MSVAANHRAVSRSRSRAEFISKLNVVIEEADESLFWLEALTELKIAPDSEAKDLLREGDELVSIFVASQRTARRRLGGAGPPH